jgi:hypothetical protein
MGIPAVALALVVTILLKLPIGTMMLQVVRTRNVIFPWCVSLLYDCSLVPAVVSVVWVIPCHWFNTNVGRASGLSTQYSVVVSLSSCATTRVLLFVSLCQLSIATIFV